MELEEHINKLKIAMQAFLELEGIEKEEALSLAQSAHREYALDKRTEYIAASRGKGAVVMEDKVSNWKDEPATQPQKDRLYNARVPFDASITKGEADALIKKLPPRR